MLQYSHREGRENLPGRKKNIMQLLSAYIFGIGVAVILIGAVTIFTAPASMVFTGFALMIIGGIAAVNGIGIAVQSGAFSGK